MSKISGHPDVVSYVRRMPLPDGEDEKLIVNHLKECGECRDLVLFVRKTSAMLRQEGRISRVAKALRMTTQAVKDEMGRGTSVAALINRPPESSVPLPAHPKKPISPVRK